MKITFILPHAGTAGGIRVVAIYARRLMERGNEVLVVSQPQARRSWRDLARSLVRHGRILGASKKVPSYFDGLGVPHRVLDVCRPVTDDDLPDADVVVATWWETAEWVARLSSKKGAKAYFIQHHEVFDYLPKERVKATWLLPLHKITISKWLVDLAREQYGDNHVSHVPNSVDMAQFHAPERGRQAVPTVGLLYAQEEWKGCAVSFAAFARAAKEVPGLHLISFGAAPPVERLPLPSGTEFHLLPPQEKLKELYARCDVWLCGSFAEGFHLPILEAMACRCPVVSTAVGGSVDSIEQGVNGYLVPVGNSEELGDRLIEVLRLPESRWLPMSAAAHQTAISYSWDDATERLEQSLGLAIERHRAGQL
jgi:glycosyltransferase involved in cell wall biosynthesis